MSGKCHQKCSENVRSVWNLSGILIKSAVRNFFMSRICPVFTWTNSGRHYGQIKLNKFQACKIPDNFRTNKTGQILGMQNSEQYSGQINWTNSGHAKFWTNSRQIKPDKFWTYSGQANTGQILDKSSRTNSGHEKFLPGIKKFRTNFGQLFLKNVNKTKLIFKTSLCVLSKIEEQAKILSMTLI